jgi:hypothetical protein
VPNYREDALEVMRALVAANFPQAVEGKMFGSVAWFTDAAGGKKGKLFASVFEEGVTIKLPRERIAELVDGELFQHFEPYGMPPMREWLYVIRADAEDYAEDLELLRESAAFVAQLAAAPAGKGPGRKS